MPRPYLLIAACAAAVALAPARAGAQARDGFVNGVVAAINADQAPAGERRAAMTAAVELMASGLASWDAAVARVEAGFASAIDTAPPAEAARMHMALGAVYLDRGRNDAAIDQFNRAAARAPEAPEPHAFRGVALERLAWSEGPRDSGPHTARTAEAAHAYGEAWQRDPANLVNAYRFLRASRGGPGGPGVAGAAAALVAAAGRPAQAGAPPFALPTTDLLDDAMSPTPVLPLAAYAEAFRLLRRGKYDEAVTEFRRAVAAPPVDRRLTPAAAAADTSALGAMPIIGAAPLFATIGLQAHIRLDLDEAVAAYERRIALAPNDSAAHAALAEVYRARDDADAALVEAAAAALLDSTSATPLVMIGQLHAAAGRDAEALPVLQRATGLAPDDAEARYALGRALLRLGRADEAQRQLDVFRELQAKAMAEQRRQFDENFRKIEETLKAVDPAGDQR